MCAVVPPGEVSFLASSQAVDLSWVSVVKSSRKKHTPAQSVILVPKPANGTVSPHEVYGKPLSPSSRSIGKILKTDIEDKIKFWSNVVVCYVTSGNPSLQVVEGFVRRIWKDQVIDKIDMVNRGVCFVRFGSKED